MLSIILNAALLFTASAYMQPRFARYAMSTNVITRQDMSLLAIKPDLFSDDLFDDEDDTPKKKASKETPAPKQKYLDQKWKLAEEDAKEFNGWTKKEGTHERLMERLDAMEEVAPADRIPSVALIYNFRREYKDQNLEATLADHRAHCLKFNKRLLHSEVINTIKTKGVVLLWVGLSPDDDLVRQEMMTFMEEDPLIVKDIVDNWNIQDLDPAMRGDGPPPVLEEASAK